MSGSKWKMENVPKTLISLVLISMEPLINELFANILRCIRLLGTKYEKPEKFRTYAQALYLVGANAISPYIWRFKG